MKKKNKKNNKKKNKKQKKMKMKKNDDDDDDEKKNEEDHEDDKDADLGCLLSDEDNENEDYEGCEGETTTREGGDEGKEEGNTEEAKIEQRVCSVAGDTEEKKMKTDETAPIEAEGTKQGYDDEEAKNKKMLLWLLQEAKRELGFAFEEARAKLLQKGADPTKITNIQTDSAQQLITFERLIADMPYDQFTRSGSMRLKGLILTWKQDLDDSLKNL